LGELSNKVKDKKLYEQTIDATGGNSKSKKWLRGLGNTLKDKVQDEML
jgi:hypothetical protein